MGLSCLGGGGLSGVPLCQNAVCKTFLPRLGVSLVYVKDGRAEKLRCLKVDPEVYALYRNNNMIIQLLVGPSCLEYFHSALLLRN